MRRVLHRVLGLRRLASPRYWRDSVLPALRRARHVDSPGRFLVRELTRAHMVATYRTSAGPRICLRHEGIDSFVFEEVLIDRAYEPPAEVARILSALDRPPRILDLGANIGLFGVYSRLRWPGSTVLGYEPDPANAALHRRCMSLDHSASDWELRQAFAGTAPGSQLLEADGSPLSRAAAGRSASTVAIEVVDAMPDLAACDLAKIDVEGAEWAILADPRLGEGPAAVVLEFHSPGCPTGDPATAAEAALRTGGYRIVSRTPSERHLDDGARGVLWAIRG